MDAPPAVFICDVALEDDVFEDVHGAGGVTVEKAAKTVVDG